ncbi:1-acylglycerol-3-phosphate O-acyltransferase ABHD5-like [Hydractinia symbiolongicarpus]|uniref:1-acylglycerol-3-phosphate O-acyltransferase ABHD5-like n=1 Tax=Hydractinia symbiolongicarpus TaxID=13093 RepID=UPI00254C36B2|nr:1-acylglycerol-3-phosphate O-acyltransferase ABHD5-like [Hydractinia symbiolongicarpus]
MASTEPPIPHRAHCWRRTSTKLLEESETRMLEGVKNPIETSFTKISHGNHIRTIKVGKHSDRIPLVLLHGFAGGLGFWTLNLDSLSQKQNVYAIDILGFGRSSRPKFSADPSEAEAVFTKSLEEWRIEIGLEDFILVGHSFGGYLAAAYTLSHPKRVKHLILVDPWGFPEVPEPGDEPIQIPGFVKLLVNAITSFNLLAVIRAAGPLGPGLVKRARSDLKLKFERIYGEGDARIMDYIYHCNAQDPSGETAFMNMADINPFPYAKNPMITRLKDIQTSISLFYGEKSWMELISDFNSLVNVHEDITVEELKGASHHVYADNSDEFNEAVNKICDIKEFERHYHISPSKINKETSV